MRLLPFLLTISYADNSWFETFHTLEEIRSFYDDLATTNRGIIELVTDDGYPDMFAVSIGKGYGKGLVSIDCGKFGSDWLAVSTCQYITAELLKQDNMYDYIIFPMMNPTGYQYTRTNDRLWQKNTRTISSFCFGVFLDRNYAHQFSANGNACSNDYPGEVANSEIETEFHVNTFERYASAFDRDDVISVTIQKWGSMINVPFNNVDGPTADMAQDLATKMASAASAEFSTVYNVGVSPDYSGSGVASIFDSLSTWTFEINPRGQSAIANEDQILPAAIEAWRALQMLQQSQIDQCGAENLKIGAAKYDTTGPIAMVNLMGFASPAQTATGLHGRLYARALYVKNCLSAPFVYVTIDNGMGSVAVKRRVVEKLNNNGININGAQIIYSGTHTHSGPAGMFDYFLFEITSQGYVEETTEAMADGVYNAIISARSDSFNSLRRTVALSVGQLGFKKMILDSNAVRIVNPIDAKFFFPKMSFPYLFSHNPN